MTGRELVLDRHLAEQIEHRFQRRGLIMTANNQRQAYIPQGAIPVENPNGTAPSFIVEDPRGVVFALPGVPFEMKWLFDNEVVPYLQKKFALAETLTYRILKVAEIGESSVDDRIGHLIAESSNPTVGVLAHPGQVDVRIAAKAATVEDAHKLIAPLEDEVRRLLDAYQAEVIGLDELKERRRHVEEHGRMLGERLREIEKDRTDREQELRLLEGLEAFCQSVRGTLDQPSFEVRQKVLQLVVDRIVIQDSKLVIHHVMPVGPVRLRTDHHEAACPGFRGAGPRGRARGAGS